MPPYGVTIIGVEKRSSVWKQIVKGTPKIQVVEHVIAHGNYYSRVAVNGINLIYVIKSTGPVLEGKFLVEIMTSAKRRGGKGNLISEPLSFLGPTMGPPRNQPTINTY